MKTIIATYANFNLVQVGKQVFIEDTYDNSSSSPLHPSIVGAIIAHPQTLLDVQLMCPTPRAVQDSEGSQLPIPGVN